MVRHWLVERTPQIPRAAFGSALRRGSPGCLAKRPDRVLDALGRCEQHLSGDLLHGRRGRRKHRRRPGVLLRSRVRSAVLVDSVAHDRVDEPERWFLSQEVEARQSGRCRGERLSLDPRKRRGVFAVGAIAENRDRLGQGGCLRRQS